MKILTGLGPNLPSSASAQKWQPSADRLPFAAMVHHGRIRLGSVIRRGGELQAPESQLLASGSSRPQSATTNLRARGSMCASSAGAAGWWRAVSDCRRSTKCLFWCLE